MSRKVAKGKGPLRLKTEGRGAGKDKGRKGRGGMNRPGTMWGSDPKGYSSGIGPKPRPAAKGREEAHPGHTCLPAARRARVLNGKSQPF